MSAIIPSSRSGWFSSCVIIIVLGSPVKPYEPAQTKHLTKLINCLDDSNNLVNLFIKSINQLGCLVKLHLLFLELCSQRFKNSSHRRIRKALRESAKSYPCAFVSTIIHLELDKC